MIVPKYWAEARLQEKKDGKQRTLYRYGWSSASQADAQRMAEERVRDAMARHRAGEGPAQREPKVPYNGADGVPIREEILEEHGRVVITRNSYGARCLNTPDVLIADVDFESPPSRNLVALGCVIPLIATVAAWLISRSLGVTMLVLMVSGVLGANLGANVPSWVRRAQRARRGDPEQHAMHRLRAFCERHPEWLAHAYRTPLGLRVIATHRRFDPREAVVGAFFEALEVDPLYRRMTELQRCFRARLTAKPWRIGITSHLRPRPGVWPVKPEHLPRRSAWIAAYEAKAADHAACRWMAQLGAGKPDPEAEAVRRLHDALSGAETDRPIA